MSKGCRLPLLLVLLLIQSEAAVHLTHSILLDEFDISGQASVSLDSVCKENGCKVYVSTVKSAAFIDGLKFNDDQSLKSFAYDFDKNSQQKIPFIVEKGQSTTITNSNADLACGPIVVYAVSTAAPNFDIAGVYDVSRTYRDEQTLGKVVTVMGPSPFTVWASSPGDTMEASVKTTGFDVVDADACEEVHHSTRGLTIKYAVAGPITTLFFAEEVVMNVEFLDFFESELDLTSATFFTSPGYIGCANGEAYRSSLYPSTGNFTLTADVARTTRLEAYLNTQEPVTLRIDGDGERSFTGKRGEPSYQRSGEISAKELLFTFEITDAASSFLIKFTDLGLTPDDSRTTEAPPETAPPKTTRRTLRPTTTGPTTSVRPAPPTSPEPTSAAPTTAALDPTTSAAAGVPTLMGCTFLLALVR